MIVAEADKSYEAVDGPQLENKIILAIASRLKAEKYMIARIADVNFVGSISANQTQKLLSRFKQKFPGEVEVISTLDRIALMTPENIHVNSFMYEPLIDMSSDHLRKLYGEVSALKA